MGMDSLDRLHWIAEAAEKLVNKMHEIHANTSYHAVWSSAVIHGIKYTGPTYEKELEHLRELIETKAEDE